MRSRMKATSSFCELLHVESNITQIGNRIALAEACSDEGETSTPRPQKVITRGQADTFCIKSAYIIVDTSQQLRDRLSCIGIVEEGKLLHSSAMPGFLLSSSCRSLTAELTLQCTCLAQLSLVRAMESCPAVRPDDHLGDLGTACLWTVLR